jgi:hypothetical protein
MIALLGDDMAHDTLFSVSIHPLVDATMGYSALP